MKHLNSLKLGALLVLAPAGLMLSGCGGGNGVLNHTGTTNPGTSTGAANFTVAQTSGGNFGAASFASTSEQVTGGSSTTFRIDASDSNERFVELQTLDNGAPVSLKAGQTLDLANVIVFVGSGDSNWGNFGGTGGTIKVTSVSGTKVTFQFTDVTVTPSTAGGNGAQGTLTLNGTLSANIPVNGTTFPPL